jgi:hypothetical protein
MWKGSRGTTLIGAWPTRRYEPGAPALYPPSANGEGPGRVYSAGKPTFRSTAPEGLFGGAASALSTGWGVSVEVLATYSSLSQPVCGWL